MKYSLTSSFAAVEGRPSCDLPLLLLPSEATCPIALSLLHRAAAAAAVRRRSRRSSGSSPPSRPLPIARPRTSLLIAYGTPTKYDEACLLSSRSNGCAAERPLPADERWRPQLHKGRSFPTFETRRQTQADGDCARSSCLQQRCSRRCQRTVTSANHLCRRRTLKFVGFAVSFPERAYADSVRRLYTDSKRAGCPRSGRGQIGKSDTSHCFLKTRNQSNCSSTRSRYRRLRLLAARHWAYVSTLVTPGAF